VLDSNVLVSAFAMPYGVVGQIFDAWQERRFLLVTSDYIINEIGRILEIKIGLEQDFILHRIEEIYYIAEVVEPAVVNHQNIDENDLPILGTAVAGYAGTIVTGDNVLLKLRTFRGIRIISPRDFLDELNGI